MAGLSRSRFARINSDIYVAAATECVRFTGEPVVIQRDAVRMTGIEFTAGKHQFQLFHYERKGLVELTGLSIRELASDIGSVGQIVKAVALLY